jgi:hypothetical protein
MYDIANTGNNKITELRTIFQRESQNSQVYKISQQPESFENRSDPDLVQVFLKKWWVESDFKATNSRFHYGSKVPAVTITVFLTILEQNSCQSSTKFSEEGGTSIVNHLHQQPRVT